MHSLRFTAETSSNGVIERDFTLGEITGVIWSPASGSEHAPLVLMGHGGGLHKKTPALLARAHDNVTTYGFTVAAIDAPGHGDRPRTAEGEQAGPASGRLWRRAITNASSRLPSGTAPHWPSVPYRNGRRPWTPSRNCRRSAPKHRSATAVASHWAPRSGYR